MYTCIFIKGKLNLLILICENWILEMQYAKQTSNSEGHKRIKIYTDATYSYGNPWVYYIALK